MPANAPSAADYQLPVEGFRGTPEEIERQWFERCYKGRGDSSSPADNKPGGSVPGRQAALDRNRHPG